MTNILEFLQTRRSASIGKLATPGPDKDQIKKILEAATRVPDHNKLSPWWFVVFEGESRTKFGEVLKRAYGLEDKEAAPAKLDLEAERFTRAPVVIAVISRIKEGKAPQWEQILSAGAVAYNLCLAANALGFGTNWVTEWAAYNGEVQRELGLDDRDNIAGFVYIGTNAEKQEERERPALNDVVNYWSPDYTPQKGDKYGKAGLGLPKAGFKI